MYLKQDLHPTTTYGLAHDINTMGQIVGCSTFATGARAFRHHLGSITDLGTLPGFTGELCSRRQ